MKYYFKENFHLIYADGQLYDENNDVAYEYENKTIFFPEIDLYKDGEMIGYVKKQFKWFLRSYDIYHHDEYVARINQELSFLKSKLSIDELGWIIDGDFLNLHYQIHDGNNALAKVDQELFRLTKRYYIEIFDEDNEELLILTILAINQFDKDSSSAAASSGAN